MYVKIARTVFGFRDRKRKFKRKDRMEPIQLRFKDDGKIPNSPLPLLIYKGVYSGEDADYIQTHFESHDWSNAWRDGIFNYVHYHSNTHEVLGVFEGFAKVRFGGDEGETVSLEEGDVVVIPAGVGHQCLEASDDFEVVGAYPGGSDYDIRKGEEGDRPKADENISKVPMPECDPVYGKMQGVPTLWKS
jgi:uncharacterized protein YjlB